MKLVTWNINSLRVRAERVAAYLDAVQPDVLCLQETKVVDELFPKELFEARGYAVATFGQKTYNGVAIASRLGLDDVATGLPGEPEDAARRLIAATVQGLRVVNVYVPNGQAPGTEKFAYKLEWLARLRALLDARHRPEDHVVVCGDFNIAPDDRDVHDPALWRGKIHFSEPEHEALRELMAFGLEDLFRLHHDEGGHFTWWDYRMGAFHRGWGLRIDLMLGTHGAAPLCREIEIHRNERKGPQPSDHAPVMAVFADLPR